MPEFSDVKQEIPFLLKNLLKAALYRGNAARQAFSDWQEAVDFERLDFVSYRFLPQLYLNLQSLKIEHRLLPKIKGIYRKTWIENQLFVENLRTVIDMLERHLIRFVITSCIPRIMSSVIDRNVYALDGLTVSIEAKNAAATIKILCENGWLPNANFNFQEIAQIDFVFLTKANQFNLILNWQTNFEILWQTSEKIEFAGKKVNILSAEEQLLQICSDEFSSGKRKNGLWIFLAHSVLQNEKRIDWKRVVSTAKKRRMGFELWQMLDNLRKDFGSNVPAQVLRELKAARPKIVSGIFRQNPLTAFYSLRSSYQEQSAANGEPTNLAGFYIFLQKHWNAPGILHLTREILRRLRQMRKTNF